MSTGGATVEDVALMKKTVGPNISVKASTGITDRKIALDMIRAGAVRLGASKGIEIVTGHAQGSSPAQPACVGCGNCNVSCPTGNAQVVKVSY
jgi:deoxyribose-phosphate aldolase